MRWQFAAVPIGVLLVASADDGRDRRARPASAAERAQAAALTSELDLALAEARARRGLTPGPELDDLAFARRLWLDLLGTVPSLEELRAIEAAPGTADERRAALIERALRDPRFPRTFAEQLARVVVGGPDAKRDDLLYRRRRLVDWLAAQLARRRPWDALVRELITAEGLSTGTPATNFTVAHDRDPVKLAGRTARAFLGVRIDCAQCHDHPFADWRQADFEGLAAFFARVTPEDAFVREGPRGELELDDFAYRGDVTGRDAAPAPGMAPAGMTPADMAPVGRVGAHPGPPPGRRWVAPAVPFSPELLPAGAPGLGEERGALRRRAALARWVAHPDNPWFAPAVANRLWGWLFGRALVEPPDELDTGVAANPRALEALAGDLRARGFDLERLVRAIVSTRAYRAASTVGPGQDEAAAVAAFAAYPVKPLRAEPLAHGLLQATSLWTYDARRFALVRLIRAGQRADFLQRRGDRGDPERPEPATLLDRLALLNGAVVLERTKPDDPFGPAARLPALAPTDAAAVEAAFLMALARRPDPDEAAPYVERLAAARAEGEPGKARAAVMSDLLWALLNTTEYATNH
ncbi:MAG: DUF1549 domain-containing protein [Opitutaceae bacterium]|nr:DUF1549 domain-containing protein [Opitutaceae bacterium]